VDENAIVVVVDGRYMIGCPALSSGYRMTVEQGK